MGDGLWVSGYQGDLGAPRPCWGETGVTPDCTVRSPDAHFGDRPPRSGAGELVGGLGPVPTMKGNSTELAQLEHAGPRTGRHRSRARGAAPWATERRLCRPMTGHRPPWTPGPGRCSEEEGEGDGGAIKPGVLPLWL